MWLKFLDYESGGTFEGGGWSEHAIALDGPKVLQLLDRITVSLPSFWSLFAIFNRS